MTGLSRDKKVGFSEGFIPSSVAALASASGEDNLSICRAIASRSSLTSLASSFKLVSSNASCASKVLIRRRNMRPITPTTVTNVAKNFRSACFPLDISGTSLRTTCDDFSAKISFERVIAGAKAVIAITQPPFQSREDEQIENVSSLQVQHLLVFHYRG